MALESLYADLGFLSIVQSGEDIINRDGLLEEALINNGAGIRIGRVVTRDAQTFPDVAVYATGDAGHYALVGPVRNPDQEWDTDDVDPDDEPSHIIRLPPPTGVKLLLYRALGTTAITQLEPGEPVKVGTSGYLYPCGTDTVKDFVGYYAGEQVKEADATDNEFVLISG